VEGGAIMTPAAPASITLEDRPDMAAKPAADTPTMTGTRPATVAIT
jgi:hypothetical protein